jgi:hypothetical protein
MDRKRSRREFEKRLEDGWNDVLGRRVEGLRKHRRRFRTRIAAVTITFILAAGLTDAMLDEDGDENLYVMIDDAQTESIAGSLFE